MEDKLYLSETIREMDHLPCAHPASVNLDVANTYFALTKIWRPLLVVEIGCFIGFSTQHFGEALRHQGFGRIVSIDAFDWDVETGQGMQNRYEVAEHYRHKAGLQEIITYVKGYSTEVYPQLAPQLRNRIDLLYIDGDHSVAGVFNDFNTYYNDVRLGGYLILHDIYPAMCGVDGPRVLIDTLRVQNFSPRCVEIVEMNTRDGFGICVLRKVNAEAIHLAIPANPPPMPEPPSPFRLNFTVTDAANGRPIASALFDCPQRFGEQRTTDAAGRICLNHYLPGRYQVNLSAAGYIPKQNLLVDLTHEAPHLEIEVALEAAAV